MWTACVCEMFACVCWRWLLCRSRLSLLHTPHTAITAIRYDLVDEDLRNTLGIEHALHRKKIINAVRRLKHASSQQRVASVAAAGPVMVPASPAMAVAAGGGAALVPSPAPGVAAGVPASTALVPGGAAVAGLTASESEAAKAAEDAAQARGIRIEEVLSWIRHGKNKKVAEALSVLPDRPFDPSIVVAPFVDGFGTQ